MRILIKNKLSEHKYKTPEGYLVCVDSPIARTGPQEYRVCDIDENSDDESPIEINRNSEDVFSPETIASFENKPLTNEHPTENVTPTNFRNYSVGFARDIHQGKFEGQDVILGTLIFTDEEAISDIESGRKTELSCGYDCDIVERNGKYYQTNIRGNHIALCEAGRAGIAKILDSALEDKPDLETNSGKQDYYFQQLMAALSILKPRDWNRVGAKINLSGNNITFTASPKGIMIYNSKNGNKQLVTSENEIKSYIKQHYINDELIQSGSKEALQKNIKTEIESGKDPKQAVAIAYATKRKNDVDTREESTKKLKQELPIYEEDSMKKYYITYKDLYLNQLFKDTEIKANSINEALQKLVKFGAYDIMVIKVQTDTDYYPRVFGRLSELRRQNFEDEKPEEIEVRDNEVIEEEEVKVKNNEVKDGSLAHSKLRVGQPVKFKKDGKMMNGKVEAFWYKGNPVKEDHFQQSNINHDLDHIVVLGEDGRKYRVNRYQLSDSKGLTPTKAIDAIKKIKKLSNKKTNDSRINDSVVSKMLPEIKRAYPQVKITIKSSKDEDSISNDLDFSNYPGEKIDPRLSYKEQQKEKAEKEKWLKFLENLYKKYATKNVDEYYIWYDNLFVDEFI